MQINIVCVGSLYLIDIKVNDCKFVHNNIPVLKKMIILSFWVTYSWSRKLQMKLFICDCVDGENGRYIVLHL